MQLRMGLVIFLSALLVACGSVPPGTSPTQTPFILVITATPDIAQETAPVRRTRTPLSSTSTPVSVSPPATGVGTPSVPTVAKVPLPPSVSCSGTANASKIGVWIYNHIGGNDPVYIRIDDGVPISVPPRSNQPGQICIDLAPGTYVWSASVFRGGSTRGTLAVVSGQPVAPINFCLDEDGVLTTTCGAPPVFVTPTPTPCCARWVPVQPIEQIAFSWRPQR